MEKVMASVTNAAAPPAKTHGFFFGLAPPVKCLSFTV